MLLTLSYRRKKHKRKLEIDRIKNRGIQDEEILDVTIYLDEMYLPKIKGETIKKDGKKLRGISNNKIGIGVATNKEKSIFIVTWTSKPSFTSTLRTYGNHIREGSTIIHDKEKSHTALVTKLEIGCATDGAPWAERRGRGALPGDFTGGLLMADAGLALG